MPLITLTTDFGADSPYVAAMKGVIASINPAAVTVDVTHSVPPQDVLSGALVMSDTCRWFPPGTIHLGVVDPGVGTDRKILCLAAGEQLFVGPDNGLLSLAAMQHPGVISREVTEPGFRLPQVSTTFHGRDVMAPAAAHLSLGVEPSQLGRRREQFLRLELPEPQVTAEGIQGELLTIDAFGNAITNVTHTLLAQVFGPLDTPGDRLAVSCGGHRIDRFVQTYGDASPGSAVALIGSTGRFELAVVGGSAAAALALKRGQKVIVARRPAAKT